jgi:hypothetical protein
MSLRRFFYRSAALAYGNFRCSCLTLVHALHSAHELDQAKGYAMTSIAKSAIAAFLFALLGFLAASGHEPDEKAAATSGLSSISLI